MSHLYQNLKKMYRAICSELHTNVSTLVQWITFFILFLLGQLTMTCHIMSYVQHRNTPFLIKWQTRDSQDYSCMKYYISHKSEYTLYIFVNNSLYRFI